MTAPTAAGDSLQSRIVSLDMCADQMVLGLVPPGRIAAVSAEASLDDSLLTSAALVRGRVRPNAEAVLALRPTLVVASYGGGPRFAAAMQRAGVPVYTLPYADSMNAIRRAITDAGQRFGAQDRARQRIREMDALISVNTGRVALPALYMTPGDVTMGPDSLIGEMMRLAGFDSFEQRSGWHSLPVEVLIARRPHAVVRAFFDKSAFRQDSWSSARHAQLNQLLRTIPSVSIPGSEIACGNWRAGHAIARMRALRQQIAP